MSNICLTKKYLPVYYGYCNFFMQKFSPKSRDISVDLHTPYLERPVSESRENALAALVQKNIDMQKRLICIDGTRFTDFVTVLGDENFHPEEKTILLPAGIDALVLHTREKSEIAMPVADCGGIVASHRYAADEKIIASAHLGYKGVVADGDLEKNGMIENFITALLRAADTKNINEFEFFLGPMAGDNFELEKSFFDKKIAPFIKKQSKKMGKNDTFFRPENFYTKVADLGDGVERVYFNLQKLIVEVMRRVHHVDFATKNIHKGVTTSSKNYLSSYRMHTLARQLDEKIPYFEHFRVIEDIDPVYLRNIARNLGINEQQASLLLSGKTGFYLKNNSRLSLNISTKK